MVISVKQAQKMIDDLRDQEITLGRDPKTWFTYENHVYGTAEIARRVATELKNTDPERMYVKGLLHDICRTEEGRVKRFHGVLGYEKMIERDEDVARGCLLHSFTWNKLLPYQKCAVPFFYHREDYQMVADFIEKNPPTDEDYLLQLCDNLANKNGFVTLEERLKDLIERHGPSEFIGNIETMNKLKKYFDDKIGHDVYDLFNPGKREGNL